MRLLIEISKLYMGGFSKSLINFLLCIQNYPGVDITLLILENGETELEKDIPSNVNIIRLEQQIYRKHAFSNGLAVFYHYKYVAIELLHKYFLHTDIPGIAVREYSQSKLRNKAKCLANDFLFVKEYDAVISWEEGYCNYVLVDKMPAKQKIGFIHPNYLEAKFSKNIDRYYIRKLDRIVVISDSCYQTLCEVFPWAKSKIVYAPNRLNYRNLEKKANEYVPKIDKNRLNLLTVARMVDDDKAIFRIVDLVLKLKNKDLDFRWYLIGDGSDFLELQSRIIAAKVQDYLICLGELSNPCPYMKAADLFVMQSHREGRPVAVDEALLLGTPALITRYSSAEEQINQDQTGWIVEDSLEAIYDKLLEILKNPNMLSYAANHLLEQDRHRYEDCSVLLSLIEQKEA